MNRRRFIQSLAAVFTLPAGAKVLLGSAGTATAAVPTAVAAVPAKARFWAIYMTGLHGECTPQTMQNLLHIPAVDAKRYVSQLIAEGVIKPHPLLQRSVAKIMENRDEGLLDKVKKRLEMKERNRSGDVHVPEATGSQERFAGEVEPEETELEGVEIDGEDEPESTLNEEESRSTAQEPGERSEQS